MGNTVSSSFHVTNRVKEGGIISPVLFNVYMDDLSISAVLVVILVLKP